MYNCKFCNKGYLKPQSLGAHVPRCKSNPNYEQNMAVFRSSENKSHEMSKEAKEKISVSMKKSSQEKVGKKTNRFSIKYKDFTFKNKWELIFALHCEQENKKFEYEAISVSSPRGKFVCDFIVDNVIYQIGWYERADSVKYFEQEGYKVKWLCGEDIEALRVELDLELKEKHNLTKHLDSSQRWTILPRKNKAILQRAEMAKKMGRDINDYEYVFENSVTNELMLFDHIADYVLFANKKLIDKKTYKDDNGVWHCE